MKRDWYKRCRNELCEEPLDARVIVELCPACRRMALGGAAIPTFVVLVWRLLEWLS